MFFFPMRHLIFSVLNDTKAFKGGSERLLVSIDKYPVQVTCQGILESDKESCGQIILDMPKTYTPFGFGSVGDETAEYILPYRMVSRKTN